MDLFIYLLLSICTMHFYTLYTGLCLANATINIWLLYIPSTREHSKKRMYGFTNAKTLISPVMRRREA